jgi:hypothetical protein
MQYSPDHRQAPLSASSPLKRLGGYLVEAGLLTHDQVSVILNDQQATGMRFGEIVVARGWLKEQTIEWIMTKVVEPERRVFRQAVAASQKLQSVAAPAHPLSANPAKPTTQERSVAVSTPSSPAPSKAFVRREAPISKPLPSVGSADGDVNWVG